MKNIDLLKTFIIIDCLYNIVVFHIQSCHMFDEVWEDLCRFYETKNVVIKMDLKDKLQSYKMKEIM
jgi:hypothetical protein